jgi:hypothetical protein
MKTKKSAVSHVFIYAISALIIIVVLYVGYRAVNGFQKANQNAIMEKFQLRLKADMSQLSMHYGSEGRFSYNIAGSYSRLCFVDLNPVNITSEQLRNSTLQQNYSIIWDSVKYKSPNNAFAFGETFLPFDSGRIHVECSPFILCINSSRGMISFKAIGEGDSVTIKCE